ncbi:MAG: dephospho-CoA kinase [Candidatus Dormibacteraeota bacterium]|uniref:Dephospho-CoA kinase n=1 Tax=Candidatus Dormiibacter inghamiae TaxID=3127013 RepID=A0A934K580_9BACT|nr:dephospho-CoA kinase [Candidatus Dormibacteraeota bacterium]MBJ7607037.1 dephospho-CoA kinase [Candidatus Dormibacteraeota bacterium]
MKVVGLTGGIGTGKSAAAELLVRRGLPVIDADKAARAVQAAGSQGLAELASEFGSGILTGTGDLDRQALAAQAFGDPERLARLNAIVHPRVRAWMAERQRELEERGERVVVLSIPLLYEARGAEGFSAVMVIYAPRATQLRRLVEQRGMTPADAEARIAAQLPIEEKRLLTPYVIDNSGPLDRLAAEVDRVWSQVAASLA